MKFKSKSEFQEKTETAWNELWKCVAEFKETELNHNFRDPPRHTSCPKDILAHLYAWHVLLLDWIKTGAKGQQPDLPAKGFNWRQTRELNQELYEKHRAENFAQIKRKLVRSHNRIMKFAEELDESELLVPSEFAEWTGKLSLCSYIAPNTFSHYRWAKKALANLRKL